MRARAREKRFRSATACNLAHDVARFGSKEPPASQVGGPGEHRFLPGFQRLGEVLAELLGQRPEGHSLPASAGRAGAPAGATALSDWPFCLALPRPCAGEPAVINHESL